MGALLSRLPERETLARRLQVLAEKADRPAPTSGKMGYPVLTATREQLAAFKFVPIIASYGERVRETVEDKRSVMAAPGLKIASQLDEMAVEFLKLASLLRAELRIACSDGKDWNPLPTLREYLTESREGQALLGC